MRPTPIPVSPVLRFAPSPNGALHLGHAYSALCNQRLAEETGGRLLLRIEDLDRTRCKPAFEAAILDDLAWLGVRFDGVAAAAERARRRLCGGASRASSRAVSSIRASAAGRRSRAPPQGRDPDGAPLYRGACRALSPAERRARLARGRQSGLAARHGSAPSASRRRGSSGSSMARGSRPRSGRPIRRPGATSFCGAATWPRAIIWR